MTEIKSSLEIALERTQDIQGDKSTLTANERRNEGKRLASKYLNTIDQDIDPASELKQYAKNEAAFVREGFFQTMLANLSLPSDESFIERIKQVETGLHFVIKDRKQVSSLFQQIEQFFVQYLQAREQLGEQLKQQFAPQLQEKARRLSEQMGTQVQLKPESDPEFMGALAKNLSRLEEQYNQALSQAKDELKRFFDQKN